MVNGRMVEAIATITKNIVPMNSAIRFCLNVINDIPPLQQVPGPAVRVTGFSSISI